MQRLAPLCAKKQAASTDEEVDLDMVALEAESDGVRAFLQIDAYHCVRTEHRTSLWPFGRHQALQACYAIGAAMR